MTFQKSFLRPISGPLMALLGMVGCLTPDNTQQLSQEATENPVTIQQNTLTDAPGAMAAKIIFKGENPSGSFNFTSTSTGNNPGEGHAISRIFNADGTLLSSAGYSDSDWPKWIRNVEIGISGANNPAATDTSCARFATAAGDGAAVCQFDLSTNTPCGAPLFYYRISEIDCANTGKAIHDGDGGPTDGVYIRIELERSHLAKHENVMMVVEYLASALNPPPQDPSLCFQDGVFDPANVKCSDFAWQIFLKDDVTVTTQPFVTLVPPMPASISTSGNRSGTNPSSRRFYFPLAANPSYKWIQLSRIRGLPSNATNFSTACASNSPLCVGMVFYSITLYRI